MIINILRLPTFGYISYLLHHPLQRILPLYLLVGLLISPHAFAGAREQAKRLHDRIAGVPPTAAVLDQMAGEVASDPIVAAYTAMENSAFYNVTVKNFAAPWTNRDQSVFTPLNDYIATVIGLVRDGATTDFRQLLYGNILYVGDSSLGLPAYSNSNNAHYESLEQEGHDLKTALVAVTQSSVTGLPAEATAGVMTTRAAAHAFFIAGTNRAMFRFTLLNHLCVDLEQVKDITLPPDRIRQDVSRSPGGDSRIFLNKCVGCHSGMDPMAQAFAYYEWEYDAESDTSGEAGRLIYNATGDNRVQDKYFINANNFQYGFITPDDKWDNYWRQGQNTVLGWDSALSGSGNGAKSMGQEMSHSEAFASCQVKKAFKAMCLREPLSSTDQAKVEEITTSFRNSNYNLKQVFAETAVWCMGD